VQQRHGSDRLAVVLLSVDPEYFGEDRSYISQAGKILTRNKIDWPSVFLPGGWNDCARMFNLTGYGLVLVDTQGIVRSINPRPDQLEVAVERILREAKPVH
jgi:hypothetical protein